MNVSEYGYPDLMEEEDVFKALLGYGMFTESLPPCFSSKNLLKKIKCEKKCNHHSYINYSATRHTSVARQLGIPHPESYIKLCEEIRNNWQEINKHIGKPHKKFSFCHVRKIKSENYIFEMNYKGQGKWEEEELKQEYSLGRFYVVSADISACFPSVYSHSIPWAIEGKEEAKINKNNKEHWPSKLDKCIRNCKDGETNGLLIGPHTSNIISEIVLTAIDKALQDKDFKKVIRNIDDYTYFAPSENRAIEFIKYLELALKEYDLRLSQKKTKILPLVDYFSNQWAQKLNRYNLPQKNEIDFPLIDNYMNYAFEIANATEGFAPIKYAIKVISKKKLLPRAKRLYVKKMLALSLIYPYLIPLLENYVFHFSCDIKEELPYFLKLLFDRAMERAATDALAFCFYYAIRYDLEIEVEACWDEEVIKMNDCISMLLAWKYAKKQGGPLENFDNKIEKIKSSEKREQDNFWLFLYEHAKTSDDIPQEQGFLKELKKEDLSFLYFLPS